MENEAVTIRDLVRHALRHRPDYLVLGEVRGKEATDLLQALDTGHGGSLTTIHANSAESVLARIVNCAMQDGCGRPWEEICRSVVDALTMGLPWSCTWSGEPKRGTSKTRFLSKATTQTLRAGTSNPLLSP